MRLRKLIGLVVIIPLVLVVVEKINLAHLQRVADGLIDGETVAQPPLTSNEDSAPEALSSFLRINDAIESLDGQFAEFTAQLPWNVAPWIVPMENSDPWGFDTYDYPSDCETLRRIITNNSGSVDNLVAAIAGATPSVDLISDNGWEGTVPYSIQQYIKTPPRILFYLIWSATTSGDEASLLKYSKLLFIYLDKLVAIPHPLMSMVATSVRVEAYVFFQWLVSVESLSLEVAGEVREILVSERETLKRVPFADRLRSVGIASLTARPSSVMSRDVNSPEFKPVRNGALRLRRFLHGNNDLVTFAELCGALDQLGASTLDGSFLDQYESVIVALDEFFSRSSITEEICYRIFNPIHQCVERNWMAFRVLNATIASIELQLQAFSISIDPISGVPMEVVENSFGYSLVSPTRLHRTTKPWGKVISVVENEVERLAMVSLPIADVKD